MKWTLRKDEAQALLASMALKDKAFPYHMAATLTSACAIWATPNTVWCLTFKPKVEGFEKRCLLSGAAIKRALESMKEGKLEEVELMSAPDLLLEGHAPQYECVLQQVEDGYQSLAAVNLDYLIAALTALRKLAHAKEPVAVLHVDTKQVNKDGRTTYPIRFSLDERPDAEVLVCPRNW